ncbi:tail fiber assembly protein [Enterobacter cloacae]
MAIYYDSITSGFYNDDLRSDYESAGTWPADAIELSDRWYQYLLNGQSLGRIVTVNEYGKPVLADPPAPSKEQLIADAEARKAALMSAANGAIAPLRDAVDLGMATKEEETRLLAWREYRVLLMRIDTSLAADIEWPVVPD